jgi:Cu-processing system permease protein
MMDNIVDILLRNPISIIAKKEIMDTIRNKWIILIISIITILTLLASYGGSFFGNDWSDLSVTIVGIIVIVQIFVSIMGLMLGYATIVGEVEKGSMNSLLSLPSTRLEILIGKFLGLGSVLTFSLFIGFGISAVIIGFNVENVNYPEYLSFVFASILLGLVFLSIGMLFSSLLKKRSTAMGASIGIWILFMPLVWGLIMGAIAIATNIFSLDLTDIESIVIPDWYYGLDMINPIQIYSYLVSLNVPSVLAAQSDVASAFEYPSFVTIPITTFLLFLWIVVCLILAYWRFSKKDI